MKNTNSEIDKTCPYCGLLHSGVCGRIKSIEYFPNGMIKNIEFKKEEDYPYKITQAKMEVIGKVVKD